MTMQRGTMLAIASGGVFRAIASPATSTGDTVRTRLRASIRQALLDITTANGYRSTVRQAFPSPVSMEGQEDFPCINMYWGREDRQGDHYQGNDPLIDIRFVLGLECYISDTNDLPLAQDKLLADVQEMFGRNFWIPHYNDGEATAFNAVYLSSTPWGPSEAEPKGGIAIEVEVFYSYNLKDPTVMTHS